jgi:hypothetical protein
MLMAATKAAARSEGATLVRHTAWSFKGPLTQSGYRLQRAVLVNASRMHFQLHSVFLVMAGLYPLVGTSTLRSSISQKICTIRCDPSPNFIFSKYPSLPLPLLHGSSPPDLYCNLCTHVYSSRSAPIREMLVVIGTGQLNG